MKRTTKLAIGLLAALTISATATAGTMQWQDERKEQQATEAMWNSTAAPADTPAQGTTAPDTMPRELEGKIISYEGKVLTIQLPFGGEEAFTLADNVYMEDSRMPQAGSLVEIKVRGNTIYHLDTERKIEAAGIIRSITDTEVTVEQNGVTKTFPKSSSFRLKDEGLPTVTGVPAEIQWNSELQITEVEVDD